jgi:hypothetical protein
VTPGLTLFLPLEEGRAMRRVYLLAALTGLAAAALFFVTRPSAADRPQPGAEAPATTRTMQLPIGQVVLFSSGVGYFQREGSVEDDARIDLSFPVSDINDLLKSMVLRDLNGGRIASVSYDSNAPVERTLKSFAINLTGNPSFGAILSQARGEKVEVVLQQTNATQPGTLSGAVVGIEKQKIAAGKDAVEVDLLNLWCSDGMRSLKMTEIQRVRFLNPIVDGEFKKALETLALSHDTQKKSVSIHCIGEGKRNVRVGYVIENPIWKTSYRLVLDKKEQPYLQGWAIVDNPTDEDWKDVRMALVSGRPISFQMDLYTPLFVPRPVVEPELFASLRPPTYNGDITKNDPVKIQLRSEEVGLDKLQDLSVPAPMFNPPMTGNGTSFGLGGNATHLKRAEGLEKRMELGKSVGPAATAAKLGDFFQYAIDKPVNLPRQKSAMLPIVAKDIEGTRVSIYNESTQAKHPLLGVKLKNTSGLHLMQGPITVFEGSNYAGDSRILDLQPNEERLISYAIDLGAEVNPVASAENGRLVSVKAVKGLVYTSTKIRETKTYTIKNRNDVERVVLIEHPVRNEFKLVETDKPAETASDFYRFQVKVAPGKTETQTVTEEHVIGETVAFSNLNDDNIRHFLAQTIVSPKVKAGLEKAMKLRWDLNRTQEETRELGVQLKVIVDDQVRLRANLKEMPATAEAYKRYLKKFDDQETQIEDYQARIKKLQGVEHSQKKEFDDFLANFSAE